MPNKVLYFYSQSCTPCKKMAELWKDKDVKKTLKAYKDSPLKIDIHDTNAKHYLKIFGVTAVPTVVIVDENENRVSENFVGLLTKRQLLAILDKYKNAGKTEKIQVHRHGNNIPDLSR